MSSGARKITRFAEETGIRLNNVPEERSADGGIRPATLAVHQSEVRTRRNTQAVIMAHMPSHRTNEDIDPLMSHGATPGMPAVTGSKKVSHIMRKLSQASPVISDLPPVQPKDRPGREGGKPAARTLAKKSLVGMMPASKQDSNYDFGKRLPLFTKDSSLDVLHKRTTSSTTIREALIEAAECLGSQEESRGILEDGQIHPKKRRPSTKPEEDDMLAKTFKFGERLTSVVIPMGKKKSVRQDAEGEQTKDAHILAKRWIRKLTACANFWADLDIWSTHFKEIEGRFGSATASYFRFTCWLLFLNVFTFIVISLVVVIPFHVAQYTTDIMDIFHDTSEKEVAPPRDRSMTTRQVTAITSQSMITTAEARRGLINDTSVFIFLEHALECSKTYTTTIRGFLQTKDLTDKLMDLVAGTGWLEDTSMFYGYYHNYTYPSGYTLNVGLTYLMGFVLAFLLTFLLILVNASHSVKEMVMDNQELSTVYYTNNVLCGWDFSIFDEKSASNRKNILFQEFKADLLVQSKRLQQQTRTQSQRLALIVVRVTVNILAICIQGASLYLIYFTTKTLLEIREKTETSVVLLMIQFLPSLTITMLNSVVPVIFKLLVTLEDYWPALELKVTLIRLVFLRLSSLGFLIFSLYYTLMWPNDRDTFYCLEEDRSGTQCCGNFLWLGSNENISEARKNTFKGSVLCWENYVGQQFYKLAIVDFGAMVAVTIIVEFPRKFIVDRFREKYLFVEKIGLQEFDLPRNVLDIIYTQSLGWLGMFFAPLLPVMTTVKIFLVFYLKKITLLTNYVPSQNVYKLSKSNSFFNLILLLSFLLVVSMIGYMITNINPSKSCGPYRVYSMNDFVVWRSMIDFIEDWPTWASGMVFFLGTAAFSVPLGAFVCLLIYYYWTAAQGYKKYEEFLREEIKLEANDRQFLLARVNDMIQQGVIGEHA